MKAIPIEVRAGVLRLPAKTRLPSRARLAVLVMEKNEKLDDLTKVADAGGAFDLLQAEPDLYSDADVVPKRRNPRFRCASVTARTPRLLAVEKLAVEWTKSLHKY